jgi:hypothetical protein
MQRQRIRVPTVYGEFHGETKAARLAVHSEHESMKQTFRTMAIVLSVLASSKAMPDGQIRLPTHLSQPVELVRRDLATRLGIASDSIEITRVEQTLWPDKCLGLPAPELCAPGNTPGYRITLWALGQNYIYHTDRNETFRFAGPGDVPRRP